MTAAAPAARAPLAALTALPGIVRRYPLISYFAIAYAISWTYDVLFLLLFPLPDILGRSAPRDLGPALAAVIVTYALAGRKGLAGLAARLKHWRVAARWYGFVVLAVPTIYVLGVLSEPAGRASFSPPSPAMLGLYPVFFLVILVLGGPLFEEPGWRGFALPRMQARWGPLAGSVMLGALWAGWHAPEFLTHDFAEANGGLTLSGVSVFAVAAISFSVIIAWVFNHTGGSLFVAILLHTCINFSQGLTSDLFPDAGFDERGPVAAFAVTAIAVAVATRGALGYRSASSEAEFRT